MMGWGERVQTRLDAVRAAGQWRSVRALDGLGPDFTLADGSPVVSFASNDYLGLATHPAVVAAAHAALDRWGAGSGSARLVVGARPIHEELEVALADWKGMDRAVLFPTGFAANLGVLSTLAAPGTVICSDELNHASIIDGCRLSRAAVRVFPHGDLAILDAFLTADQRPKIVVTDSTFSMDGDAADLDALADLCTRTGALLLLDEAHAVWGPEHRPGRPPRPAPGAHGNAVEDPRLARRVRQRLGRPVRPAGQRRPPVHLHHRLHPGRRGRRPRRPRRAALPRGRGSHRPGARPRGPHRRRLRHRADHPSPIVPIVLGDEDRAVKASAALLERGLLVPAIRPPTVAPGTSRLRVTLSAAHTDDQVTALADGLAAVVAP